LLGSETERAAAARWPLFRTTEPNGDETHAGPGRVSRVMVMVVVVTVVVILSCGSERRAGKHHQEERCCEKLLHGTNVARPTDVGKGARACGTKRGNRSSAVRVGEGGAAEAIRLRSSTKE